MYDKAWYKFRRCEARKSGAERSTLLSNMEHYTRRNNLTLRSKCIALKVSFMNMLYYLTLSDAVEL